MKTLSIKQPWAELIIAGHKDIENRTWKTNVRGQILIQASQSFDFDGWAFLKLNWFEMGLHEAVGDLLNLLDWDEYQRGGIVGQVEIVDCVTVHESLWKEPATYGFVLANAKRLPFKPLAGKLGFFEVTNSQLWVPEDGATF